MGEGDHTTIKFLMLAFNLLFWVSGIGLIVAGALAQTVYNPYLGVLNSTYLNAPVLLIVIGAIISIIAFFGCCGSSKENYCMLMTFAVMLGIIFVVELAGGIAAYVEHGRIDGYLADNMVVKLNKYNTTDPLTRSFYDKIQGNGRCCGVYNYTDWMKNSTNSVVPQSCCNTTMSSTVNGTCDTSTTNVVLLCPLGGVLGSCPIYRDGCQKNIQTQLEHSIGIIGGVAIGVAFIQLIGITFACILARRVRRGYSYS